MKQKITLSRDGVCVPSRMKPFVPGEAHKKPPVRLARLHELLKTREPNICVVRGEGLGDVIMTTPVVHALKKSFDKVRLSYATNTKYLDGALVKVLSYNSDISHIIERQLLDPVQYDLVVNLHCPCVAYEKHDNPPVNRIDLFAKHVGLRLADTTPKYYLLEEEIEKGYQIVSRTGNNPVVLVQPFASSQRRSWPPKEMKETVRMLGSQGIFSLVITHSGDNPSDVLWNNMSCAAELRDLDVRQIAGVMANCDLVLCPDSSILHLAGAIGTPTVSLFGPTHPAARVNYYPNAVALWGGEGLKPCPCWFDACPIGEVCWSNISSKAVLDACMQQISKTKKIDFNGLPIIERETIETEIC